LRILSDHSDWAIDPRIDLTFSAQVFLIATIR